MNWRRWLLGCVAAIVLIAPVGCGGDEDPKLPKDFKEDPRLKRAGEGGGVEKVQGGNKGAL